MFKERWYGSVGMASYRLLNLSFGTGVVPMDWRGASIVPPYKGKGDKFNVNVATREVLVC